MSKLIKFYILLIGFIIFIGVYGHYNFEINRTESLPLGIYHISSDETIRRNDIVVFCPPYNEFLEFAEKQGYFGKLKLVCDNKTPKYMKKAVGLPGDDIFITAAGVYINKRKIKNSEPYEKILSDKIFQNYFKHIKLQDKEYFLISDYNKLSFDSRYFGIVKKEKILYKVFPLFTY